MKNNTDNGIITGILLRMDDTKKTYARINYVNSVTKNIAHKEGLHYVNTEAVFEGRPELLQRNGRVFNAHGITHLGIMLSTELGKYINTRHLATRGPQNDCMKKQTRSQETLAVRKKQSKPQNRQNRCTKTSGIQETNHIVENQHD